MSSPQIDHMSGAFACICLCELFISQTSEFMGLPLQAQLALLVHFVPHSVCSVCSHAPLKNMPSLPQAGPANRLRGEITWAGKSTGLRLL